MGIWQKFLQVEGKIPNPFSSASSFYGFEPLKLNLLLNYEIMNRKDSPYIWFFNNSYAHIRFVELIII